VGEVVVVDAASTEAEVADRGEAVCDACDRQVSDDEQATANNDRTINTTAGILRIGSPSMAGRSR